MFVSLKAVPVTAYLLTLPPTWTALPTSTVFNIGKKKTSKQELNKWDKCFINYDVE